MVAMILCSDCLPEGREIGLGLVAPKPRHCHGKNDRTIRGVMGGVACPCECNRSTRNASPADHREDA